MQHAELTVDRIFDHAGACHGAREIVTCLPDGGIVRSTYAQMHARAKQVSNALLAAGIRQGDRVATLGWNGASHFEAWYGIVGIGAVCHTLNPRLFAEQLVYIVNHAEDRILLADAACVDLVRTLLARCPSIEQVVWLNGADGVADAGLPAVPFEQWISGHGNDCRWGGFGENAACGLCYTSGTTGNPKGVLYTHRSNYLHALMTLQRDALALSARDTILLIVPMYHANAWGIVYSAPAVGAKLVLPGPRLDGASVYELLESEQVTYSSAVPTVWQMLLQHMKAEDRRFSSLKRITVGGSACPEALIRTFEDEYGIEVMQGWGMTETSPLVTVSTPDAEIAGLDREAQLANKLKQGRLLCGVELKLVDDAGNRLPHDGHTFGRLKVRGPTIARGYFRGEGPDPLDDEGFLDTGDVSTIDPRGYMQITDRAKDVIKSGGEWISSVEVENLAMCHPQVACAAVIGVPHPKWDERPLLIVQANAGAQLGPAEMLSFLEGKIARWWMPDAVVFVEEIPLGATGKVDKKALRLRFKDHPLT